MFEDSMAFTKQHLEIEPTQIILGGSVYVIVKWTVCGEPPI